MDVYLSKTGFMIVAWFLVGYMIFCNLFLIISYFKDRTDRAKAQES